MLLPQGWTQVPRLSADQSGLRLVHGLFLPGLSADLLSLRPSCPFPPAGSLALPEEQVCRSTAWRAAFTGDMCSSSFTRTPLAPLHTARTSLHCLHPFVPCCPLPDHIHMVHHMVWKQSRWTSPPVCSPLSLQKFKHHSGPHHSLLTLTCAAQTTTTCGSCRYAPLAASLVALLMISAPVSWRTRIKHSHLAG